MQVNRDTWFLIKKNVHPSPWKHNTSVTEIINAPDIQSWPYKVSAAPKFWKKSEKKWHRSTPNHRNNLYSNNDCKKLNKKIKKNCMTHWSDSINVLIVASFPSSKWYGRCINVFTPIVWLMQRNSFSGKTQIPFTPLALMSTNKTLYITWFHKIWIHSKNKMLSSLKSHLNYGS